MRAILTYHSIDPSGSPISCRPEAFARHVRWLVSGRVNVVDLSTLVGLPHDVDAVAITFDDGFRNVGETALPLLRAHGLPGAVFVVAGQVGGTNAWRDAPDASVPVLPLLDWDAVAALAGDGIAIGSHSRTHRDLTRLDAPALEDELRGSAEAIECRTGVRPDVFAYPYGCVDPRTAAAVGQTYRLACTTEFRTLSGDDDRSRLPRLDAFYFDRHCPLESWGTPAFMRFLDRRRRLRRARAMAGRMLDWRPGR